jgi:hypothetical protein
MVTQPLRELPTLANRLEVVAKSAGSGEPVFTSMDVLLYSSFEMHDF